MPCINDDFKTHYKQQKINYEIDDHGGSLMHLFFYSVGAA